MGSGPSKKKKVDNIVAKVGVINALSNDNNGSSQQQSTINVYDFVKARKEQKSEDWREVEKQYTANDKKDETTTNNDTPDPLYKFTTDPAVINICPICNEAPMLNVDGFACRVCGRVYHKDCVSSCGHYTKQDVLYMDRALTHAGWSCHECDNICTLLTPPEMQEVSDRFDKYDINKDCGITEEEYMDFQKRCHQENTGRPMSPESTLFQQQQFQRLDADSNGSLDYWEFMKHESSLVLSRRDPVSLVSLLTPHEKAAARTYYETFDVDGDGVLVESEARKIFRSWYTYLERATNKSSKREVSHGGMNRPDIDSAELSRHVNSNAQIIMDADANKSTTVTWKEFLDGQALYIISSRPNKASASTV